MTPRLIASTLRLPVALVLALGVSTLLAACAGGPPGSAPAASEFDPAILVPIYFYHGYSVGKGQRSSGLQVSRDGGATFGPTAWKELIANSAAVDEDGRRIYLACGNGVMVSPDAGKTWRLTGGWEMTEVQRVVIGTGEPRRLLAATAYGVFVGEETEDGLVTWTPRRSSRFRYCTDVLPHPRDPRTFWVASDRGIFVTRDGGDTYGLSLDRADTRRLIRDRRAAQSILAATDGLGLLRSDDDGKTWRRIEGPPPTTTCVVQHPTRPATLLVGTLDGLYLTTDDGKSWRQDRDGLPEGFHIHGAAVDPGDPDHFFVGGTDGLFARRGAGAWQRAGFKDALIHDLTTAQLARAAATPPAPGRRIAGTGADRSYQAERWAVATPGFEARRDRLRAHFDSAESCRLEKPWGGWLAALSRVRTDRTDDAFWQAIRTQLEHPQHSMFYGLQLMAFYLHAGERLPADIRARIRTIMTEAPMYRGDTENHWVMHYSVLLLATEQWPGTKAAKWYAGRDTAALHDEARGWLEHWAKLTATRGQGEFDSPNYMFMYVAPMMLLNTFARSQSVKQLSGMTLDLLLADYFTESLAGAWCGGHSRVIGKEVEVTRGNRVTALHWLYAGGIPQPEKIHAWMLFCALSAYRPPAVLAAIANRRDAPYVHTEVKRVRNVIRLGDVLNPPVHKYDFMTPGYGMGSLQGGILQPIQQHTWDVTWLGSAENATLFSVHPSVSWQELARFFPEHVKDITSTITKQKGAYGSPDKWMSASEHERVYQHEHVLLALYRVPDGAKYPHGQLYWPKCLTRTKSAGWWFGRDGDFFVACRVLASGQKWEDRGDHWRLRFDGSRAGVVVVTPPREGHEMRPLTFEQFRTWVPAGKAPMLTGPLTTPTFSFTDGDGTEHAMAWNEPAGQLEGKPDPFPDQWLYRGPFLNARTGWGIIRLTDGAITRELDFNRWQVNEEKP